MGAFAVDPVIPKNQQGETQLDNLAWSCQGCNEHKHTKTQGRDLLITATGTEVMTAALPTNIEAIEQYISGN